MSRIRVASSPAVAVILAAAMLAACSNRSAQPSTSTTVSPPTASSTVRSVTATTTSAPLRGTRQPRTFAVSPTNVVVGHETVFSGSGCPARATVLAGIDDFSTGRGVFAQATPAADGSWSTAALVGDATIPGTRTADAECVTSDTHEMIFQYKPVRVQVSTIRALHLEPGTTVRQGTTLTITETGGCPQGAAYVVLQRPGTSVFNVEPANPGGFAEFPPDAAGAWHGHLVVPANSTPGSYVLNVTCAGPSRSVNAFYPLVPTTVTAS